MPDLFIRKHYLSAILLTCTVLLTAGSYTHSQTTDELLGITLKPEVKLIVAEIENKTHKRLEAEFTDEPQFQFGSSFIDDDTGRACVYIESTLERNPKKLEAVIVHELLHLRLRVNNYPTFLFSPSVNTAKGRAVDVEQSNINDLLSIIEHQIFKADMERFGLYKYIDLAGDTAADARKTKGREDGQADAINYARAILEYHDQKDVALVRDLFAANGWKRSLKEGQEIADLILRTVVRSPKDVETVFGGCLRTLYMTPRSPIAFKLSRDPANKYFQRMIINTARVVRKKN